MTDKERRTIRSNAMSWAVNTSKVGEDAQAILARAQLYEEFLLDTPAQAIDARSGKTPKAA